MADFILWPSDDLVDLADTFVARGCRVSLRGGFLSVEPLLDGADATAVARDYVEALRARVISVTGRLMTLEEFGALPVLFARSVVTARSYSRQETVRRRTGLRDARRDLIAATNQRLSQAYDYFQSAIDDPDHAVSHLYKMIETMEGQYGSEAKAVEVLGMPELKRLKRLANDSGPDGRDQRHAPMSPGSVTPLTESEVAVAQEDGQRLLDRFEELITGGKVSTTASGQANEQAS